MGYFEMSLNGREMNETEKERTTAEVAGILSFFFRSKLSLARGCPLMPSDGGGDIRLGLMYPHIRTDLSTTIEKILNVITFQKIDLRKKHSGTI